MLILLIAIIYLSFFGLGLPDSMLGAAWPTIFSEMDVPVSGAGILSAIIAFGTIISSLASDRITRKLGASKTTAISVAITALALLGFGVSTKFWQLCLISIPYGLGAGSVDAALNNYVSLHFSSKHMNWLHCMWGLGAAVGPVIMGAVLTGGASWHLGYVLVSVIQIVISTILFISLPIWKKPMRAEATEEKTTDKPLSFKEILGIRGVKAVMVTFFAYCALEVTVTLWASSYLNLEKGIDSDTAALWGSLYVLGITVGRAICGFISIKLNDVQMTRLGEGFMVLGLVLLFLPLPNVFSLIGLITLGIGSAPVYPSIIHSTPARFGETRSQALIGVQMASAYTGTCLMPPLFGLIANHVTIKLFPLYIAVLAAIMIVMFEVLNKRAGIKKNV
ncbi:MAG: MFS transporter [Clostridia bacterium]|nr:MFS transporter [Clostridia bacterium]